MLFFFFAVLVLCVSMCVYVCEVKKKKDGTHSCLLFPALVRRVSVVSVSLQRNEENRDVGRSLEGSVKTTVLTLISRENVQYSSTGCLSTVERLISQCCFLYGTRQSTPVWDIKESIYYSGTFFFHVFVLFFFLHINVYVLSVATLQCFSFVFFDIWYVIRGLTPHQRLSFSAPGRRPSSCELFF